VEHIHLVVHQGVHSFQNHLERQVVPRSIDHHATVHEFRLVFDMDRESGQVAGFALRLLPEAGALEQLGERLNGSHETDIGAGFEDSALLGGIELIGFLFQGECTSKCAVVDEYFSVILKVGGALDDIGFYIGLRTAKILLLVMIKQLVDVSAPVNRYITDLEHD
jgi:hypothetical protein